jgi:hypothetical protein
MHAQQQLHVQVPIHYYLPNSKSNNLIDPLPWDISLYSTPMLTEHASRVIATSNGPPRWPGKTMAIEVSASATMQPLTSNYPNRHSILLWQSYGGLHPTGAENVTHIFFAHFTMATGNNKAVSAPSTTKCQINCTLG